MKSSSDLSRTPVVAIWETNPACSRTAAWEAGCGDMELSTAEAEKLIHDIVELQPPIFIFAGDDPLKRRDIFQLVYYAAKRGLHPVMALGATPLLDRNAISELKHAGLSRLALTLDAAVPELHDSLQYMHGSHARVIQAMHWANDWRLPLQVNTHLCNANLGELEDLGTLLADFRVLLWNLIFPVPGSATEAAELPTAAEFEASFARLHRIAAQVPFKIKTSEAPHYRRFVLQQRGRAKGSPDSSFGGEGIPGIFPVNEARGTIVVSHDGEVYPGPSLRVSAGNVRDKSLAQIYRDSELFTALRDPENLTGKCGACNFKQICGGSRARALALAADMFTEDASCDYEPPKYLVKPSRALRSGDCNDVPDPEVG